MEERERPMVHRFANAVNNLAAARYVDISDRSLYLDSVESLAEELSFHITRLGIDFNDVVDKATEYPDLPPNFEAGLVACIEALRDRMKESAKSADEIPSSES